MDAKEQHTPDATPLGVEPTAKAVVPTKVGYDLIKSNFFRVIYADGVFGGVSPTGMITMSFFNERFPIPRHLEHELLPTGTLGKETRREERDAIVREIETEVVLSLESAKVLRRWLDSKIAMLESVRATIEAEGAK